MKISTFQVERRLKFFRQKISIINNAFIISNSPWEIGGKGKQVIISGKESNLGGGILIGDTNDTTIIENTEFSFLGGYDLKKFRIYYSWFCKFSSNKCKN